MYGGGGTHTGVMALTQGDQKKVTSLKAGVAGGLCI